MALPKTYRVQMRLGVTNKTYDTEQAFEPVAGAVPVTGEAVSAAIATFVGEVQQVPPAFSAIKIDGVPGYEYAKRGKATVRAAKLVRIDRIAVESYTWPILTAEIHCGRGTYIRAIARDLGRLLGCGAVCETLTRTAVGPFRIEDSVDLTRATDDQVRAAIRSINETVGLLGE
jgi:tRNA pseudouridine55 synthase